MHIKLAMVVMMFRFLIPTVALVSRLFIMVIVVISPPSATAALPPAYRRSEGF
ncbi:hypothetical protein OJE16_12705 [Pantoea tagorei]